MVGDDRGGNGGEEKCGGFDQNVLETLRMSQITETKAFIHIVMVNFISQLDKMQKNLRRITE